MGVKYMYLKAIDYLPKGVIKKWLESRLENLNNDLGWQGYTKNQLVKLAMSELDNLYFCLPL